MPATAELRCTSCGTTVIVLPSMLHGLVPAELEADFLGHTREIETEDGKRFAIANDAGSWACPSCGRPGPRPHLTPT
jgi:rubrerythrin